jgi:hypothetical protein
LPTTLPRRQRLNWRLGPLFLPTTPPILPLTTSLSLPLQTATTTDLSAEAASDTENPATDPLRSPETSTDGQSQGRGDEAATYNSPTGDTASRVADGDYSLQEEAADEAPPATLPPAPPESEVAPPAPLQPLTPVTRAANADLPGFVLSPADRLLDSVFGDHVHGNDGTQLRGDVVDVIALNGPDLSHPLLHT